MSLKGLFTAMLPKGGLAKGVAVLVSGSVLGSALAVLASPFLTRLFSPEDFGILAVFNSILEILGVIACWRYQLAIPLPKDDQTAGNLVLLCLEVLGFMIFITCLGIWFWGDRFLVLIQAEVLGPYLWYLPLALFFLGGFQIFSHWAIRKKDFGAIAKSTLSQEGGTVVTQLSMGLGNFGPAGLLVGKILGQIIGTIHLVKLLGSGKNLHWYSGGGSQIRETAVQYKRFPFYSTWSGLFNTVSKNLPVLLLTYYFGPAIAGFFALSRRVLQTPMNLIGQAIAKVFFSEASEAIRVGKISSLTEKVYVRLLQVGTPLILIIGLAAPEVFSLVFGDKWREAGVYTQWLAPFIFLVFITTPMGTLPSVLGKQKQELVFQTTLLIGRIVSLIVGGTLHDPRIAIALYAGSSALAWFVYMLWNMQLSGHRMKSVMTFMLREIIFSLPLVLPLVIIKILHITGMIVQGNVDEFIFLAALLSGALLTGNLFKVFSPRTRLL